MSPGLIAAVVVVAMIPLVVWLTLRRLNNTPGYAEIQRIPFKERWRLGRLARSQTYITPPEDSRKAEELMRASKKLMDHQFSRRHMIIFAGLLILGRLVDGVDVKEMLLFGGLIVVLGIGYLWNERSKAAVMRTAEINGWDLEERGSDA